MGITVPSNLSDLYSLNYLPLLTRLRKDLDAWRSSQLPWFGRISSLKMVTLPKSPYLFQTIPISVPKHFFNSLRSMSIRFVWHQGLSRIRHTLLTYPKICGGLGLPDFKMYHRAALLSRVLEWFPRPFPKASTSVEQDLSHFDLQALLWGYGQQPHLLSLSSPLTVSALHLWYKKGMSSLLSTDPSPLTSLFDHPSLPQGMGSNTIGPYSRSTWPVASSFVDSSLGTPVLPVAQGNWLTALHISSFCSDLFSSSQIHRHLTGFEQLCSLSETPRHLLSSLYALQHALLHNQPPSYTRK